MHHSQPTHHEMAHPHQPDRRDVCACTAVDVEPDRGSLVLASALPLRLGHAAFRADGPAGPQAAGGHARAGRQLAGCPAAPGPLRLLRGRRTYETFTEAWPTGTGDFADKMNSMPK
jgi:hypothetical protein